MLIKSFFKDKSTHKYLIILLIVSLVLTTLLILKQYFAKRVNVFYQDALFNFQTNIDLYDDIKKVSNIKELYVSVLGDYNDDIITLLASKNNDDLKNNEIVISKKLFNNVHINDVINIKYHNKDYQFKVKEIVDDSIYPTLAYISYDYLRDIASGEKEFSMYITLDNYLGYSNTKYMLQNLEGFNSSVDRMAYNKKMIIDYEFILAIINIVSFFHYIILVMIIYFVLYCLISNNKDNNYLYKCIGYNKNQIIGINIINILLLFSIVLIFNLFIYYFALIFL